MFWCQYWRYCCLLSCFHTRSIIHMNWYKQTKENRYGSSLTSFRRQNVTDLHSAICFVPCRQVLTRQFMLRKHACVQSSKIVWSHETLLRGKNHTSFIVKKESIDQKLNCWYLKKLYEWCYSGPKRRQFSRPAVNAQPISIIVDECAQNCKICSPQSVGRTKQHL